MWALSIGQVGGLVSGLLVKAAWVALLGWEGIAGGYGRWCGELVLPWDQVSTVKPNERGTAFCVFRLLARMSR